MSDVAPKKKGPPIAALVVLAVVIVCCVTSLAGGAVGWTSFQRYVTRSKASEATSNLQSLFTLSASYYAAESFESGAAQSACTVGPAATSNVPGSAKTMIDWTHEAESFETLGFAIYDPVYYQYEILGGPARCGNAASAPIYTLQAHGDLDGDGERSLFELTVESSPANDLVRAPTIRIEREEE